MRLFAHLYLDEDVDVLVARLLEARGFSATTTQESGRTGRSDREQLVYATENECALLTHNRVDFERLARQFVEQGRTHYGIILATRRPPHQLTNRLLRLLDSITADELKNQTFYV
jgi:predicted nuclease of predicted toxin-antitoxin system